MPKRRKKLPINVNEAHKRALYLSTRQFLLPII
ncbi:hypothetical protein SEI61121_11306 [Salmonella enterica subsp. indica serovar 6,14,25:z10:1,(2),7 str. 1121]|uniref:Uncharacterized protein n=1 Tax=Salmonella enterica subsp. indica serovar 6,14,25:z10:1,(2),7 str. 1121 TaxID=1173950 RepID=V1H4I2_SALER|nr:hypothetical protein SEI61121_11306 [Salmonella enterica subsp. indica serovar 6,14,25:z10:1,(2),7 str. 1121]